VGSCGIDNEISVLLSRSMYDLCCSGFTKIEEIISKVQLINFSDLAEIIFSGAVTSELSFLCHRIQNLPSDDNNEEELTEDDINE
jgi:hypothetical protein